MNGGTSVEPAELAKQLTDDTALDPVALRIVLGFVSERGHSTLNIMCAQLTPRIGTRDCPRAKTAGERTEELTKAFNALIQCRCLKRYEPERLGYRLTKLGGQMLELLNSDPRTYNDPGPTICRRTDTIQPASPDNSLAVALDKVRSKRRDRTADLACLRGYYMTGEGRLQRHVGILSVLSEINMTGADCRMGMSCLKERLGSMIWKSEPQNSEPQNGPGKSNPYYIPRRAITAGGEFFADLVRDGLIAEVIEQDMVQARYFYHITPAGREALPDLRERWQKLQPEAAAELTYASL